MIDLHLSLPVTAKGGWHVDSLQHSRGGLSSECKLQTDSCAFLHRAPWEKSTLGQPCCHLWSFYSRQVIYRNLFVQSQYLPVGVVKIYNSSVPLACCFPVNNGNFHNQEVRLGAARKTCTPPIGERMSGINGYWLTISVI
jgi:hypothetical protein